MAQDGFSTATPRPSQRSGAPQGATPAKSPVGSAPARSAPAASGRVRTASARPTGMPPTVASRSTPAPAAAAPPFAPPPLAPTPAGGAPSRPSDDDEVLTVDELVAWLRLSESTVLKLLSERAIPARKVGHQWRVRRGRVRDWLDGRE
ncbi:MULTISPECIES: helix-turn-helix domain-containing protein [unclassified Frankia]